MLKENLERIQKTIEQESKGMSFKPLLLAVSKKQSIEKMEQLYHLGQRDFAENYVQEFVAKKETLKHLAIRWHFIGAIQRKKLKDIVGAVDLIQTLSRLDEVTKIQELAAQKKLVQKVLVQVNIANEPTKNGVLPQDLPQFVEQVSLQANIQLKGLMFFPPLSDVDSEVLAWCEQARGLFLKNQQIQGADFDTLSLGTSSDFHLALRAGSTMVRLGETLFGPRLK